MNIMHVAVGLFALFLVGCVSVEGQLKDESKNKTMDCVDTRDGGSFSFSTATITNPRVDLLVDDGSFDFVDNNGTKRSFSKSMELYLKCTERK